MRTALAAFWLSAATLAPEAAIAQGFFPRPEIDYWNEARAAPSQDPTERAEAAEAAAEPPGFRWDDYQDPTTEAFWDDGANYRPPLPLRVAAANPTPENVSRYLRWQRQKLEVVATLSREVQRQVGAGHGTAAPPLPSPHRDAITPADADVLRGRGPPIDWRRLELVLFYRSDCPHCQASLPTVQELEARGAKVIPVQVDWQARPPLLPGSVKYTAELSRAQPIDAVPTWVASYQGDRLTMQGNVTVQSIEVTLKAAQQQHVQPRTEQSDGG
jgi:hypothetical protein